MPPIEVHTPLRLLVPGTDPNDAARLADALGGTMGGTAFQVSVPGGVGGWRFGDTVEDTDSVAEVIRRLLNPVVPPTYTAPTLSLTALPAQAQEIGENIAPTLTPTFTQHNGGAMASYELRRDGAPVHTTYGAFTDAAFQLTTSVAYQASAAYAQGPVLNDSAGDPYPSGQIPAGTATSNTVTYTPQRRAFYGTAATAPLTSAEVRALASQPLNPANGTVMMVNGIGANGVVFAYPAILGNISEIVTGGFPLTIAPTTVSVAGAGGVGNATNYLVYFITQAVAPTTDTIYRAVI